MLHIDMPSRDEIEALSAERNPACVTIYVATSPLTQEARTDRTLLRHLLAEATEQLRAADLPKRSIWPIEEGVGALAEDESFWAHQAHSLAVFATPERVRSYRLPNRIENLVAVADRFHIKPLLRAVAFPQTAFVLALSEGAARLVEVAAEGPAQEVEVPGLPGSLGEALAERGFFDRSPQRRREETAEGGDVRLKQYARAVDRALRPLLRGEDRPLILAAAERIAAIYPKEQTYRHFEPETIGGNVEHLSPGEIASRAREILDRRHAREIEALKATFAERQGQNRATSDLAQAARAATFGAVDTLIVDMDEVVPGRVAADGAIEFGEPDSAGTYGIVDEIAGRSLASGARIVAARRQDVPGEASLAAILRYPV